MDFEDRLSIATAEGVHLDVVVAGFGSRFIALLVDTVIETLMVLALGFALSFMGNIGAAVFALVAFFILFGYPVVFEVLGNGQTPGKRMTGLRVTLVSGAAISFVPSAIRNIVRVIDALPGTYLVGIISVLLTERNQRLGDLAAGTIVIRDRKAAAFVDRTPAAAAVSPVMAPTTASPFQTWDLSAVTAQDVATLRSFLTRRGELDPAARHKLALELATRLHPKVLGPPEHEGPERFLEWIVAAKDSRA